MSCPVTFAMSPSRILTRTPATAKGMPVLQLGTGAGGRMSKLLWFQEPCNVEARLMRDWIVCMFDVPSRPPGVLWSCRRKRSI